jgi:hypothetical protein
VPASVGDRARMLARAAGGRALTERESKAILALYGIRTTREILAPSFEAAVEAAKTIGYPVAVKAESPLLQNKSEAGAVMLDITDEVGLKRGFKRTLASAWATVPWDSIHGILVQEMIGPGTLARIQMLNEPRGMVLSCDTAHDALSDIRARFKELCHDLRDVVREINVDMLIVAEDDDGACVVDCSIVPFG